MDRNETLADIVAEMREIPNPGDVCPWWADGGDCARCPLGWDGKNCPFPKLADRIEAASKREAVAGNAAKLREALESIYIDAQYICDNREEAMLVEHRANRIERTVNAALSAPQRNCDVGTVDEQRARLAAWCKGKNCSDCEFCANWCSIGWENAPIVLDDMQEGGDHADD